MKAFFKTYTICNKCRKFIFRIFIVYVSKNDSKPKGFRNTKMVKNFPNCQKLPFYVVKLEMAMGGEGEEKWFDLPRVSKVFYQIGSRAISIAYKRRTHIREKSKNLSKSQLRLKITKFWSTYASLILIVPFEYGTDSTSVTIR